MIEYKGFIGHFIFDDQSNLFIGKVANSKDLITFQGKSVSETKDAFRDSVNAYIDWCKNTVNLLKKFQVPNKYAFCIPASAPQKIKIFIALCFSMLYNNVVHL